MNSIQVTILACVLIFISTVLGSALVYVIRKKLSAKVSNMVLGVASGVMVSAGIFGLLIPAMEEAEVHYGELSIIPVVVGFILGGIFLNILDKVVPHFHNERGETTGIFIS